MPITFPRSVGQLPECYNCEPSRNRTYIFSSRQPLFPFGYGLSYTTFKFENLRVEPQKIAPGQTSTLHFDVTNIGDREGDEVAQLYIHQRVSSITRSVMELRGFRRIRLRAGEKMNVEFPLSWDAFSLLDANMNRIIEAGDFDLMVFKQTTSVSLTVDER